MDIRKNENRKNKMIKLSCIGLFIVGIYVSPYLAELANHLKNLLLKSYIFAEVMFVILILFLLGIRLFDRIIKKKNRENQNRLIELNEELSKNKLQLQNIFNNIDVAVWCFDRRYQKLPFTSQGMKKITGYPSEQFTNRDAWKNIVHPDDISIFESSSEKNRDGVSRTSEYRIIHADGHIRWIQNRITPTMDESGNIIRLDGVIIDITARKQAGEALHRSEQRYKSLFEYNSNLICEMDLNGELLDVNRVGEEITGPPGSKENKGFSWLDFFHTDDKQRIVGYFEKTKQGQPQNYEVSTYHQDEKIIHWNVVTIPIYINDKLEGIFTISEDITIKKTLEKALADSEAKNRLIVESIADLNGVLEPDGTIRYAFRKERGPYGAGVIGSSLFDFIHEEDLDFVREKFSHMTETKMNQSFQFRFVHINGHSVFVECMATPVINFDGEVESIVAVARDVTEKGRMEKELKESEELNRRLVELTPEAIVFHYDYKCIYVNSAALEFLGASSLEDIVGRSIFEFIHPDFQQLSNFRLKEVYERQISTPLLEMKLIRKDQTVIDAEAIITPMPYMGKNAGFSLIRDVTKQKKAEEERNRAEIKIRESEERYFHLQTSLDRFSQDLFGIMEVSELNRRFVKEVQNVIEVKSVSVIQVQEDNTFMTENGVSDIQDLLEDWTPPIKNLPVNELIETLNGYILKIGKISGKNYLLYIGEKPDCLMFSPKKVWLKTVSRYINVLYDNFRLIEDLTKELDAITSNQIAPAWLLRLLFKLSENERKNLSQDLHDSALQEQIIWYRRLDQLSTNSLVSPQLREELQQIMQGLLDVIYQIRITCNELRPPMLKEEGLVSSLEALFEFTHLRANYTIQFDASQFHHTLTDDMLLGLYRIVQELLANATKHSNAAEVHVTLVSNPDQIELVYRDNGIGMDVKGIEDSFNSMGVYGVKERVRSLDGKVEFHSLPNNGLTVCISLPTK